MTYTWTTEDGRNLIRARWKSGLNQTELGEKFGVSNATIRAWEKARRGPNPAYRSKVRDWIKQNGGVEQ